MIQNKIYTVLDTRVIKLTHTELLKNRPVKLI